MISIEQKQKRQEEIAVSAIMSLYVIVEIYIKQFFPKPKTRKNEINDNTLEKRERIKTKREKGIELLINASTVNEETIDGVSLAVLSTIEAMRKLEHDSSGDITERKEFRRLIEQIKSIMHIGKAYPDDAMKRLSRLSDKLRPVERKK